MNSPQKAPKMSIANMLTEALKEDMYSKGEGSFNSKTDERLASMNDAQLAGIRKYLSPIAANTQCKYIREAFQEKLGKTETILVVREAIAGQKRKEEQSVDSKQYQRHRQKQDKEDEREFVFAIINKKAREQALEDQAEFQKKRSYEEKLRMILAFPEAEKLQKKYAIVGVSFLIIGIVVAAVLFNMMKNAVILACILVFTFFTSAFIFWRSYKVGIVSETVVPVEDLSREFEIREGELRRKGMRGRCVRIERNKPL